MKQKTLIISMMMGAMPFTALAQHHSPETAPAVLLEEGRRLCVEGHYYAARQSLDRWTETVTGTSSDGASSASAALKEAEALKLICDYHLCDGKASAELAERIHQWAEANPSAPERRRLELMRANLLVKSGDFDAALTAYALADKGNIGDGELTESYFYEAIAEVNSGNLRRARALLYSIQDNEAHRVDVAFLTAYIQYCEGDFNNALGGFQSISDSKEYMHTAQIYIADCYLRLAKPQLALRIIQGVDKDVVMYDKFSSLDYCRRIEGEALYDLGNYEEAIGRLESLDYTSIERRNRTPLYKLGMSYFNTKAYGKAADALSRSASVAQDAMAQNAWLHAGISYLNLLNKNQARMAFQQAADMTFDKSVQEEAMYNYALTLHEGASVGFGESVNVFERFLNTFPNSAYRDNVAKYLTEVYFTTRNYSAALTSINKIKRPGREILTAKQKVLLNLGIQNFMNGNYAETQKYANQAIALNALDARTLAEAYYWKGEADYRLGQYESAVNDLSRYVRSSAQRDKNYANACYSLGYAYFKQKSYNSALPYFRQCVSLADKFSAAESQAPALVADAHNRIGDCLFSNRLYDEATDEYQKALSVDASQGDYSLLQQAFILGLKGDYAGKAELLAVMERNYAASRYTDEALFEQGRTYVQQGEKNKAVGIYKNLIARFPQSANARKAGNELGMIYFEAGKTDAAIKAYTEVIDRYPNTTEAHTALANLKDIYTGLGRVDEYALLAERAGRKLSAEELDEMVLTAAVNAMGASNYAQAYQRYSQLAGQTQSENVRVEAEKGMLRSAYMSKDNQTIVSAATAVISDGRMSPDIIAEARLYRAESYMAQGNSEGAVADWQALSTDASTEYGAQGTVRLAQYAYDTGQHASAEEILLRFIDSGTPHAYWLARGFVLLSDVYVSTGRNVEARQYLLSLKSNYSENSEINKMVEERLKKL